MASTPDTPSFDQIILAGRRKKAEQLAGEIFGKSRRESAPQLGLRGKSNGSPSLASRITKPSRRSTSSSSIARNKPKSTLHREIIDITDDGIVARRNPFQRAKVLNVIGAQSGGATALKNFNIKGAAGPYVVVGTNFAPGTTGADIQSAMESVAGQMTSCTIITSNPTVIAEMVFEDKGNADKVVATLNNQRADGRLLHVYHKGGPPTKLPTPPPVTITMDSVEAVSQPNERPDIMAQARQVSRSRSTNEKRAEPEVQDGRYGFDSKDEEEMEVDTGDDRGPTYSERSDNRYNGNRPERPNYRYNGNRSDRSNYQGGYPRGYHGDRRGYDRDSYARNGGYRPHEPSRLYSDELYPVRDARGYR